MTDHFGIGAALRGAAQIYFQSARRTGRTVSMVESAKDGDVLIFTNVDEAKRVERLCKERGIQIRWMVADPHNPLSIFDRLKGPVEGRAIFDHSWVEQFYLNALDATAKDIQSLQNNLSGEGEPHRKTRREAAEIQRWEKFQ
ncbi:hypothetical protein [Hoeflea sp.]|uniref:hypothetical protein n=1 Tax=Hoeflea sp. TaxID=1940281 RepID=UPI003B5240C8